LFKRKREREVIRDDNEEDDEDDDEPIVKPKLSVLFKKEDNDNDNADNVNDNADEDGEEDLDLLQHLSTNEMLQHLDPTWGMEPQSPWSQHEDHVEQNHVIVPNITEPVVIPNLYIPEGVGLCFFNFVIYIIFFS
jgi:hypothetical protein